MLDDTLDKSTLRRILTARRNALAPAERAEIEATLLSRLTALPAWRNATVVCGYMSTRGEPNLLGVWQAATAEGKTYALPVTLTGTDEGRMLFRAVGHFCPDRLTEGRFGIAEPPDTPEFPPLSAHQLHRALILVPGLGFDREGFRIGYGGGYYDRFLDALSAASIRVHTVGLCPAVCRVDRLPREAHDRRVETVIDERNPL